MARKQTTPQPPNAPANPTSPIDAGSARNAPRFMRDTGLGTGLLPTGDTVAGDATPQDGTQKPPVGEETSRQAVGFAGVAFGQVPGFSQPLPGTYLVYRRMNGHPTLAMVYSIVTAPVMAGSWSYETRRPDGKATRPGPRIGDGVQTDPVDRQLADRASLIQKMFDPMRSAFLWESLRSLQFGWRPFEKVWDLRADGTWWLAKLKPLLPDFTWCYVDRFGNFAGVTQMNAQLGPAKSMVVTYDGEAGNFYGRSRHENARETWSRWLQLDDKSGQLANKAAAIIPLVHYPMGTSQDAHGNVKDNSDQADLILAGLRSAGGVKLPNLFANGDDPRMAAELAGKSSWVISFLEASGAAANLSGMTDRQRYYDQQLFNAWLRSPRTGMEAVTAGSRADSGDHKDSGLTDSDLVHASICEQLSRSAVDDVLALNWGADARGSVYVRPAPLQDEKRQILGDLFDKMWSNPQMLAESVRQMDMQSVYDLMELPVSGTVNFNVPDMTPQASAGKPGKSDGEAVDGEKPQAPGDE